MAKEVEKESVGRSTPSSDVSGFFLSFDCSSVVSAVSGSAAAK